jgi:hypothetical protein
VLDISDLTAIREITGADTYLPRYSWGVAVAGQLASVRVVELGFRESGIMILDVSDPLAPLHLADLIPVNFAFEHFGDVVVSAGLVYSVDDYGLKLIDLGPEYGLNSPTDALQCYDARATNRTRVSGPTQLNGFDAFGARVDRVGSVREFCTPVAVDGAEITHADAHLACHDLIGAGRGSVLRGYQSASRRRNGWEPFEVVVDNEFGVGQTLRVQAPEQFCAASSAERRNSIASPMDPAPLRLDHFQCYGVEASSNLPSFDPFEAALSDWIGDATRRVGEPMRLCAPVDVDGEGVIDSKRYLACYELEDLDRSLSRQRTRMVVSNRFAEEQMMTLRGAKTLCVPSEVQIP